MCQKSPPPPNNIRLPQVKVTHGSEQYLQTFFSAGKGRALQRPFHFIGYWFEKIGNTPKKRLGRTMLYYIKRKEALFFAGSQKWNNLAL